VQVVVVRFDGQRHGEEPDGLPQLIRVRAIEHDREVVADVGVAGMEEMRALEDDARALAVAELEEAAAQEFEQLGVELGDPLVARELAQGSQVLAGIGGAQLTMLGVRVECLRKVERELPRLGARDAVLVSQEDPGVERVQQLGQLALIA
jgi:hypothetical protein